MQENYAAIQDGLQAAPTLSAELREKLRAFVAPLALILDDHLDARLVRTFLQALEVLLCFRNRAHGLLLSELGAYLLSPQHAPAGTKRLSNLLRSNKWTSELIDRFLWSVAQERLEALTAVQDDGLVLWDESVVEKSESLQAEGLCPVRSSKAKRLQRIKPGYYHPPCGGPVFVPGLHWIALLLAGRSGPPVVAAMQWWSTRGERASTAREVQGALLTQLVAWGRRVVHIFDRGYSGAPWLGQLLTHNLRFVVRWPKGWYLHSTQGVACKAWQLTRGKRSQDQREIWDARHQGLRRMGVITVAVTHPEYQQPLWLVVCRSGGGREPWYLLTSDPIKTSEDAWKVVFAYARRWQIEMAFRYNKSELGMESPRLWTWEGRVRLLLMVTLCYGFLLSLLQAHLEPLRQWLLRHFCHRTGKRSQQVSAPLYRLRTALSRLWLEYPRTPELISESSG
jgi:hypothetical protein